MATVLDSNPTLPLVETQGDTTGSLAEFMSRLGDVPPERVRVQPPIGKATEADVAAAEAGENRLFELVDGTLVEKAMGFRESLLALAIADLLRAFVRRENLGLVLGADGMMRLAPGLVRIPDAAFVSWNKIPGGAVPQEPIPQLVPDLAIEVLSATNTPGEMRRKLDEYFAAGVRLVWLIDSRRRTVDVYSSPNEHTELDASGELTGGNVLPGLTIALADLFAELDQRQGPNPAT